MNFPSDVSAERNEKFEYAASGGHHLNATSTAFDIVGDDQLLSLDCLLHRHIVDEPVFSADFNEKGLGFRVNESADQPRHGLRHKFDGHGTSIDCLKSNADSCSLFDDLVAGYLAHGIVQLISPSVNLLAPADPVLANGIKDSFP